MQYDLSHLGDARILTLRQADPEVGTERLRHLLAEEGAEGAPVHAPHQLPEEEALGLGVVPGPVARSPAR